MIFTASGTRGIVGRDLTPEFIIPLNLTYGTWLREKNNDKDPKVLIGRDTRPSGPMLEAGIKHALLATGCEVLSGGICPTPAILHAKKTLNLEGAVIISASHNPAEYNGLKFLSPEVPGTFLSTEELEELKAIFTKPGSFHLASWKTANKVKEIDITTPYLDSIKDFIKPLIKSQVNAKIIFDSGAGSSKNATDLLLKNLGCNVISINDTLLEKPPFFPRSSEPVKENLGALSKLVVEESADLGIGLDCDADRIGLCDEKGNILREDIGLALIMKNLPDLLGESNRLLIVTNVASSLMFEDIAEASGGRVIRTPVGERYLAVKMHELMGKQKQDPTVAIVGGEGSCGGVIIPEINLARDGTLAATCIVAIMNKREVPISELVKELTNYHLKKVKINVAGKDPLKMMEKLSLLHEEGSYERVLNDLRFQGDGWWALIHPSNTEPVIRILVEARDEQMADELLKKNENDLLKIIKES
ncbi:MAG: hypothetical protein ACFFCS_24710 [Candidatus Hodarchaeota archaeon]